MEFECNTPVHWLRDARLQVEGQIVRVVLLAQVGTFPAGYVGMMDQPRANDAHDAVRIIMYTFSLIDDYYHRIYPFRNFALGCAVKLSRAT